MLEVLSIPIETSFTKDEGVRLNTRGLSCNDVKAVEGGQLCLHGSKKSEQTPLIKLIYFCLCVTSILLRKQSYKRNFVLKRLIIP